MINSEQMDIEKICSQIMDQIENDANFLSRLEENACSALATIGIDVSKNPAINDINWHGENWSEQLKQRLSKGFSFL